MDEKERLSEDSEETLGSAAENQSRQQPENMQSPMFFRSATGQYGGTQPQSFDGYGTDNGNSHNRTNSIFGNNRQVYPNNDPEIYARRGKLIKLGNAVGLPLCMFFILSYALNYFIVYVMAAIDINSARHLLSDSNVTYMIDGCISLMLFTVPYLYTLKSTGCAFGQLVPIKKVAPSKAVSLIMLGLGVSVLSVFAANVLESYSEALFGAEFKSAAVEYGDGPWSFVIMLLCVGILPALLEEFAIRGVVMGALRKHLSDGAAIAISSALFALLHGNLRQIPFAFGMGLMLGYAVVYSGSLIPSVIIHALNNCISVVMSYTTANFSPAAGSVVTLLYFAVALVIGLCGFIMLIKTDKNALRLSTAHSENTRQNCVWLLSSPWIVVFIIICVVQVIRVQLM